MLLDIRKMLVQQALDDVRATPDFSDFYLHCYYVITKLGLQLKAREEGLFASEKWSIIPIYIFFIPILKYNNWCINTENKQI